MLVYQRVDANDGKNEGILDIEITTVPSLFGRNGSHCFREKSFQLAPSEQILQNKRPFPI